MFYVLVVLFLPLEKLGKVEEKHFVRERWYALAVGVLEMVVSQRLGYPTVCELER